MYTRTHKTTGTHTGTLDEYRLTSTHKTPTPFLNSWASLAVFPRMLLSLAAANYTMMHLPDDFVRVWADGRALTAELPPLRSITPANLAYDVWDASVFR
jgi:hypothetical protein